MILQYFWQSKNFYFIIKLCKCMVWINHVLWLILKCRYSTFKKWICLLHLHNKNVFWFLELYLHNMFFVVQDKHKKPKIAKYNLFFVMVLWTTSNFLLLSNRKNNLNILQVSTVWYLPYLTMIIVFSTGYLSSNHF